MAVVVTGTIKDYSWGMVDGMVPWTGRGTGKPQAELWFGVHPAGPSRTLDGSLADVALADRDVPLLVKILAAAQPLSIQIHPDAERAAAGFAGQPVGAKTYSDSEAKTEMLVAMSEFQALAGWREPSVAAGILSGLGYPGDAVGAAGAGRWADVAGMILAGPPRAEPWDPGRVRRAMATDDAREAAALGDVAAAYPDDPGVGIAAILAYHRLQPGDALYVPVGVPHAYLRGVALEVMTSSDNVLRLGLTTKEMAVQDALRAIRTDLQPALLAGPGVKAPRGAPFRVELRRGASTTLPTGRYRVILAVDGTVKVSTGSGRTELEIGQAMLIPAEDAAVDVKTDAMVALFEAVPQARPPVNAPMPRTGG